jgi:hypothetical protein
MKKTIAHGGLWLSLLCITLTARAQQEDGVTHISRSYYNGTDFLCVDDDSSFTPARTMIIYKHGSLYNITLANDKVLDLFVDGRKVPADSFYVYQPLIKKLTDQIKKDRIQAKLDREQALRDQKQALRDQEQAVRDQAQAVKDQAQARRDQEQAMKDQAEAGREAQDAQREAIKEQVQAKKDAEQAERDRAQAMRDGEQASRDREQAVRDREQASRDRELAEEDRAIMKSLISDLVKDGIVPNEKSVTSLFLNEYVLAVNGKKLSDEVFKKYKDRYVVRRGFTISYNNR